MPPVIVRKWPTPSKNSIQLQFSSIDIAFDGVYFPWITEVNYEQNLEPGEARGTSPYPMGVTMGELKANGSITIHRIYRERFFNIIEQGTPGWMDKFFPVAVSFQESGWSQVETDTFDARCVGSAHEYSAGNGVLMMKIPLYIPYIKLNGHIPLAGIALT